MALNRLHKSAAVATLAVVVIGGAEGLRQHAYPDPATHGAPFTICYGHTGGVSPHDYKSLEDCKRIFLADLDKEANIVERCVHGTDTMPAGRYVAVLSLAHNIGAGGVCRSSVARHLNRGEIKAGCDAFLLYDRAAGRVLPGLARRREEERKLCLEAS